MFFEETYRVDSRDTDPRGICRASALLGYLQEAAAKAAIAIHCSREEMLAGHNSFWMLARIWVKLDKPIFWNQSVTVRTWHRGGAGVAMYRDFDIFQEGTRIGEAVSVWVLADANTRSLMRLSKAEELSGTYGGEYCKTKMVNKLHVPGPLEIVENRTLHYSDADINGHVNNVRYADFACDALPAEMLRGNVYVSELQIGFLAECRPGETIQISAGQYDGKWYVEGQEGGKRFDAALMLTEFSSLTTP